MSQSTPLARRNPDARRRLLIKVAAIPLLSLRLHPALGQAPLPIADMHTHFGFFSRSLDNPGLGDELRRHRVALVAWTLASDFRWIRQSETGAFVQSGEPPPGALSEWFYSRLDRMKTSVARGGLRLVLSSADVDACIASESGVVLAAEGADFLEGKVATLASAYEKGLRHLQIVHYIRNPIGDFQTTPPTHNGLSAIGKSLIQACNAQGILIDLAHSTGLSIDQALDISQVPMVWSHGWVDQTEGHWRDPYGYMQRRLSLDHAKKIAARGGVVGLWGLGLANPNSSTGEGWTVGRGDTRGYAKELLGLSNKLGSEHVALGTDIEAMGPNWSVNNYGHVRQVIDHLQEMKVPAEVVERMSYKNYARVLKAAMR